jgi:hypothetical protein
VFPLAEKVVMVFTLTHAVVIKVRDSGINDLYIDADLLL